MFAPAPKALGVLISRFGVAAVFVGTIFEGEGVLMAAAAAAQQGLLSPPLVWIAAAAGAFSGHVLWFSVGRMLVSRVHIERFPRVAERFERADRFVRVHPAASIFTLQYLYGVRLLGALALGLSSLGWGVFLLLEALNCLTWAALFAALGYGLGETGAHLVHGWVGWLWLGVSVLVAFAVVHAVVRRAHGSKTEGTDRDSSPRR